MKKMLSVLVACTALTGCANGIPECNNRVLDGCGQGHAYTEERTYLGQKKPVAAVPAPAPVIEPAPAPAPEPAPVVMPEPDDAPIMTKADEPKMTK